MDDLVWAAVKCLPQKDLSDSKKVNAILTSDGGLEPVLQEMDRDPSMVQLRQYATPAIFDREMDKLFRGMMSVAVYLDDGLVTGTDDGDHLQNLHNVQARPQDARLMFNLEKWSGMRLEEGAEPGLQRSNELITKAPELVHFDPSKPVALTVDVSPHGGGAILAKRDKDSQERPVSFASHRLHAAQQRYR
ncbi:uncharacterized protein [Dermacentor andersoni]|uniref:uncharacterized protein n=1 Tax=Dermacentor andersoni TaxID=34620 RepID=UPI003B3B2BDE